MQSSFHVQIFFSLVDDALIPSIGKEWKQNNEFFIKKAKAWTAKFAKD